MSSCLCRYFYTEKAKATGISVKGKVCMYCWRELGCPGAVSFPAEPKPVSMGRAHPGPEPVPVRPERISVEERAAALERLAKAGALAG